MGIKIITIKCKKTLTNDMGEQNFTKGSLYYSKNHSYNTNIGGFKVEDDQGDPHVIGTMWAKHFKIVK